MRITDATHDVRTAHNVKSVRLSSVLLLPSLQGWKQTILCLSVSKISHNCKCSGALANLDATYCISTRNERQAS